MSIFKRILYIFKHFFLPWFLQSIIKWYNNTDSGASTPKLGLTYWQSAKITKMTIGEFAGKLCTFSKFRFILSLQNIVVEEFSNCKINRCLFEHICNGAPKHQNISMGAFYP